MPAPGDRLAALAVPESTWGSSGTGPGSHTNMLQHTLYLPLVWELCSPPVGSQGPLRLAALEKGPGGPRCACERLPW